MTFDLAKYFSIMYRRRKVTEKEDAAAEPLKTVEISIVSAAALVDETLEIFVFLSFRYYFFRRRCLQCRIEHFGYYM